MDEKAKRTAKVKNSANQNNLTIIAIILLFLAVLGAGITIYLQTIPDSSELAFQSTATAIYSTNQMALSQIAVSATAAVQQATATENARSTRRASLQMTTTAYVHETEVIQAETERALVATHVAYTATAAYIIPIVSETAAIENMTVTALAALTTPFPSPTTAICGYTPYTAMLEVPDASADWQETLGLLHVEYRSARVFFDTYEAQRECGGDLTPLPYQCIMTEISIDISQEDWADLGDRFRYLVPILMSLEQGNICNTLDAELRVIFHLNETNFYLWEADRNQALEAFHSGINSDSFWAYGFWMAHRD